MIGVALVGFITIFASSARASIESEVARGFTGDFIVQPTNSSVRPAAPVELADQLAEVDGVQAVGSLRFSEANVQAGDDAEGGSEFIGAIDPGQYDQVFDVDMEEGRLDRPHAQRRDRRPHDGRDKDLEIGDPVTVTFPGGSALDVTIEAISDDQALLGTWTLEQSSFDSAAAESTDAAHRHRLVGAAPTPPRCEPQLEELVDAYPTLELLDRDGWVGSLAGQINALLNVVYGLLALSVIIAVIGIANTLSLSIHERTRELGLLRAVGMDRAAGALVGALGSGHRRPAGHSPRARAQHHRVVGPGEGVAGLRARHLPAARQPLRRGLCSAPCWGSSPPSVPPGAPPSSTSSRPSPPNRRPT